MDSNKLKGKIRSNGYTYKSLAKKMNISTTTMSNKINQKNDLTLKELNMFAEILDLSREDITDIFHL